MRIDEGVVLFAMRRAVRPLGVLVEASENASEDEEFERAEDVARFATAQWRTLDRLHEQLSGPVCRVMEPHLMDCTATLAAVAAAANLKLEDHRDWAYDEILPPREAFFQATATLTHRLWRRLDALDWGELEGAVKAEEKCDIAREMQP